MSREEKVKRVQELRRSNASQPHVTKVVSDQDAINEQMEDHSG